MLCLSASATATACENENANVARVGPRAAADATHCLINETRAAAGVGTLAPQGQLAASAGHTAADLVQRRYFSHTPPEGTSLPEKVRDYIAPARTWRVAENLAYEGGAAATPRQVVEHWMSSDTHRGNLLAPDLSDLGIGVVSGTPTGEAGATWATHFGVRVLGAAPPAHITAKRKRRCGNGRVRVKRNGAVRCRKKRR